MKKIKWGLTRALMYVAQFLAILLAIITFLFIYAITG